MWFLDEIHCRTNLLRWIRKFVKFNTFFCSNSKIYTMLENSDSRSTRESVEGLSVSRSPPVVIPTGTGWRFLFPKQAASVAWKHPTGRQKFQIHAMIRKQSRNPRSADRGPRKRHSCGARDTLQLYVQTIIETVWPRDSRYLRILRKIISVSSVFLNRDPSKVHLEEVYRFSIHCATHRITNPFLFILVTPRESSATISIPSSIECKRKLSSFR